MKKDLFTFVEQNDSNKQFENHLSASVMAQILGGKSSNISYSSDYCNPWWDCDAWNCAPDCTCKNLA